MNPKVDALSPVFENSLETLDREVTGHVEGASDAVVDFAAADDDPGRIVRALVFGEMLAVLQIIAIILKLTWLGWGWPVVLMPFWLPAIVLALALIADELVQVASKIRRGHWQAGSACKDSGL